MKKYTFTLEHDKGRHVIHVYAHSLSIALNKIMKAEACPERAVVNIKISES